MSSGFGPSPSSLFAPSTLNSVPLFAPYQTYSPFSLLRNNNKLKRARQRVDAGEPRNTYSSIPSFGNPQRPMAASLSPTGLTFGQSYAPIAQPEGLNNLLPHMQSAWLSSHWQRALAASAAAPEEQKQPENGNSETPSECKVCDENAEQPPPSPEPVEPKEEQEESEPTDLSMEGCSPRSKRKQYQPQQLGPEEDGPEYKNDLGETDEPPAKSPHIEQEEQSAEVNSKVQELLAMQRQWYVDWLAKQQEKIITQNTEERSENKTPEAKLSPAESPKNLKSLGQTLKSELISNLSTTVDKIIDSYLQQAEAAAKMAAQQAQQRPGQAPQMPPGPRPFYLNPFYATNFPYGAGLGFGAVSNANSIFPSGLGSYMNAAGGMSVSAALGGAASAVRRDADPYSLVLPRKKRSKVTDTRLSKMPVRGDGTSSRNSPVAGYFPPTMVGHPLYGTAFGLTDDSQMDAESPTNSDELSDMTPFDSNSAQSCTLTPMHLRKAKLMFFFTRYPSSALLKTYFPDIRFNKNNTAQLVKWFSNFREFYYIQMEKYARQAMAEGIRRPEDITVSTEDELYKVLNQHYNRNNHIHVPQNFRGVVEGTLREFFLSVQAGKDGEPSWKKQIYKVIQRLDDTIPEYFKNPNFLEQLE